MRALLLLLMTVSLANQGYEHHLHVLALCAALILTGPGWLALWDPFRFRRGARSGTGWSAAEG